MMASRSKRQKKFFVLSESSDSESSIPVYSRKKLKRVSVGQSSFKEFSHHSTDEDDNSGSEFINMRKNMMFKSRNKENTCHANVKPVIESKGKHKHRVINLRRKYNFKVDPCDSSASLNDDSSDRMNNVEVVGSSWKIDKRTSANKHDASNPVVTSTPLAPNNHENKKTEMADTNIRHRIMKMAEELKYVLSKYKLDVYHFQLKYLQDEIVTEQDSADIMHIYNNIINKLKEELTVQQQISMGPYHRCGETEAHSRSSSDIFTANYKRPEATKISKPDVVNNVNKQPLEANCTSAVTVEKNNNTASKTDESVTSILHRLTEINVVKAPSTTSVAGSIRTTASIPSSEVLNRAYKKSIGHQGPTKQDSIRNERVNESCRLTNYDSDVNSTCSTIAVCPRKSGNVEINNYPGGLKNTSANEHGSTTDVLNTDVLNRDIPNREVSKSPISDVSSVYGDESDEIPLTHFYSSDSEVTEIISNNKVRNLKHKSKDHIPAKRQRILTSSDSENIRPKQRSEFVVPDINNLSTNYRSHHVTISNRADSVSKRNPIEQNQYNTHVDKKLRMNCQVQIERFRIRR